LSKTNKTPKRKRCTRARRLVLAATWLKQYGGKRIIYSYAKYFAVDVICAMKELEMLGVEVKAELKAQILNSHNLKVEIRGK
jgi:hypothetical protein